MRGYRWGESKGMCSRRGLQMHEDKRGREREMRVEVRIWGMLW